MNMNMIDNKVIELTEQLSELKELRKMYMKHFEQNGIDRPKVVHRGRNSNAVHTPIGDYAGLTIKAATIKCLKKHKKPLDAHIVASVIFDRQETNSKRFRKMYYSAWSAMYQQPELAKRNTDGEWLAIK